MLRLAVIALASLCMTCYAGQSQNKVIQDFLDRFTRHPKDFPIYPFTFTNVIEGPVATKPNPELLRLHYELIGKSPDDVIKFGREATRFFKRRYGVDFTDVPDDVFFSGSAFLNNGTIELTHFVFEAGTWRMVSMTSTRGSVKLNNAVSEAGYRVIFHQPFQSQGEFQALIVPGSFGLYGINAVRMDFNVEDETTSYLRKPLPFPPRKLLLNTVESRTVFSPPHPQNGALIVDCVYHNKDLGAGNIRGVLIPQVSDPSEINEHTIWIGREVLTYPGALPFSTLRF